MKYFIILLIFILSGLNLNAQLEKSGIFFNIKLNDKNYINQPLSKILNEIEIDIKKANIVRPNKLLKRPTQFMFFNISNNQYDSLIGLKNIPVLIITVKEDFFFNYTQRGIYNFKDWPKEDVEKFKQATVINIYYDN